MANPGVDNKLNFTQSLGSWEMEASWEAFFVVAKRRSWTDVDKKGIWDISTTDFNMFS
jgi:hypothetical protein